MNMNDEGITRDEFIQIIAMTTPRRQSGIELIAEERKRQISKEGWTPEHDDSHRDHELNDAAVSYALHASSSGKASMPDYQSATWPGHWPWGAGDWKPRSPIRDLVRAGALIAAEIDRLQRIKLP